MTEIVARDLHSRVQTREMRSLERQLRKFILSLTSGMGRSERREAMGLYVTGLLLDGDRKSIEPMAGRLVDDAAEADSMRQRLQQCVSVAPWSDDDFRSRLALKFEDEMPGIQAYVLDDTGFAKKGQYSVGVARHDNCQVATSLHLAGERGSACIALKLYLPEEWTKDRARCRKAGVPDDVVFTRKWEVALAQLDDARRWGLAKRPVLGDAGYGEITEFRGELTARGYEYALQIPGSLVFWQPGTGPLSPAERPKLKKGPTATRWKTGKTKPLRALQIALSKGVRACRKVDWREGSKGTQTSRFGRVRVRTAHHHTIGKPPGPEEWLLWEWPEGEPEPTKFWLATFPIETPLERLVALAKLRWRVERDYQDLKGEVGLDHFEGRTWRGFHHHATLCMAAHAFLALTRAFPPEAEEEELDASDGPTLPPARAAQDHRCLPTVPSGARSRRAAPRTVAHVIR